MARPTRPRVGKVRFKGAVTEKKVRTLFNEGKIKRNNLFGKSDIKVNTSSANKFKKDVTQLRKKGITAEEQRALRMAKARAAAQILRPNISKYEKTQFKAILKVPIPKIHKIRSVSKRSRGSSGRFI